MYEFDEDAIKNLKCLIFDSPTEDWVDFVMNNRTIKGLEHDYDIVYGPVANVGYMHSLLCMKAD